ncbi:MAG: universal stress protein [Acidimicrobiales bacterium]|nr:universal stress protein [Acidimicrobiales bacterium]
MIDQVIVPLDGSEHADRALRPAIEVARRLGASVSLLRAIHPDDVEVAKTELSERRDEHEPPGCELIIDTMNGPVGAIASAIDEHPDSLVCMTTHGRSGLTRALLGSVAEEALREVDVPFLLVGPGYVPGTGLGSCVIVPVDGSQRSQAVLPVAADWSTRLEVPLWVVTVVDPAKVEKVKVDGGDLQEDGYVHRLAASLPATGQERDWEVLHSADPAEGITEFVEARNGGLIVMATHGRSGLARVALGSVASRVVRDHQGLSLVVRPSGLDDG